MLIHVQFKVNLFEVIREIYFPEVAQCLLVNNYLKTGPSCLKALSFSFVQIYIFRLCSLFFLEHPIIK